MSLQTSTTEKPQRKFQSDFESARDFLNEKRNEWVPRLLLLLSARELTGSDPQSRQALCTAVAAAILACDDLVSQEHLD